MAGRPIARAVVTLGVLLLGVVAAYRSELAYLPAGSFPELSVTLRLPSGSEVGEVARRWVVPLESAVRAAGGVRGVAGWVRADGASLRVRFRAGTDPERKAARLESELGGLRRRLPEGAWLSVAPAGEGEGEVAAIVWLGACSSTVLDSASARVSRPPAARPHPPTPLSPGERGALNGLATPVQHSSPSLPSPSGRGAGGEGIFEAMRHRLSGCDGYHGDPVTVDPALLAALRGLPEVRSVEVTGTAPRELRVRPHPDPPGGTDAVAAAVAAGSLRRRLGEVTVGGRRLPVVYGDGGRVPLAELPVRRGGAVVPLGAVATVELGRREAAWQARRGGEPGRILLVAREHGASPLAFSRALRRALADHAAGQAELLVDEAEPLRRLLARLLLGLAAAVAAAALLAGWSDGGRAGLTSAFAAAVAPLVTVALALNFLRLAGVGLDVTTLPALAVGVGAGLLARPFRRDAATFLAAGWLLPVAVALAGGRLAPLLAAPGLAFALTLSAGVASLWIVPPPPVPARPPATLARPLRRVLRRPATLLLGTVTGGYLLAVLAGHALEPHPGSLTPALADLAVSFELPEGTTAAGAAAQVAAVEARLSELPAVVEQWSVFDRRGGWVAARLDRDHRRRHRLRRLVATLRARLTTLGVAATVTPLAGGTRRDQEPLRFTDSLDDRPEIDDDATSYRYLLRATDLDALDRAHRQLLDRVARTQVEVPIDRVHADRGRPAVRIEAVPRRGADPRRVARGAALLAAAASLPAARELPLPTAGSPEEAPVLRVLPPGAPVSDAAADGADPAGGDRVRRRDELMAPRADGSGPVVPAALFELREVTAPPSVKRQSGRFVLPVTMPIRGQIRAVREAGVRALHRRLRTTPLPPGIDLELPDPNPAAVGAGELRIFAVAAALPILLLALAACRLNAVVAALLALVPLLLGVLATAPLLLAAGARVDEPTLLTVTAAVAATLPVAAAVASALRAAPYAAPLSGGVGYRWLARRLPAVAPAVAGWTLLLALPGLGLDPGRNPWLLPLRAAAVAGAVGVAASCLVLPPLLRAAGRLRHRRGAEERRRARPPAWRESAEPPELAVRHLTRVYGDGFVALRGVDFRLGPGIVGLLGPNGAGKTTLLRLLCGLLEPTRGQVLYRGVPVVPANRPEYRRRVGFLPQSFNAYEGFTAAAFLDYWALERGIRDPRARRREVERLLAVVGLEAVAGRKVRDFSGGMRRRVGIARALLGDPPILIVDEPTTGLDVESRHRLRETLLRAAGERIILFSTHIASDVAAAAGRILLLHRGRLLFDGAAEELIAEARGRVFEALLDDRELRDFAHRHRVTTRVRTVEGIRVRAVAHGDREPPGTPVEPNLEEAYLAKISDLGSAWHPSSAEDRRAGSLLDLEAWRG